jgi:hypothetical protein
MADQDVTDLTQDTSPDLTDLLYEGKDPSGTPLDRSVSINDVLALAHDYVKVSDVKAYNEDGGDFASGAWRTRTINTEDNDTGNICSISSNQITLEAGTYECRISAPAFRVNNNTARLRNITDGTTTLLGVGCHADSDGAGGTSYSVMSGRFTIAAQKVFEVQHRCFEVQHRCETSETTYHFGFGRQQQLDSGESSVFTVAEFWRVRV